MLKTLFNPIGVMSNRDYWRACEVLFGVYLLSIIISVLAGPGNLFVWFTVGVAFFSYAYFCVYGKRLQSVGLSRFWLILVFPSYWALNYTIGSSIAAHVLGELGNGYDNILWQTAIAESTSPFLRKIALCLYVCIHISGTLIPIAISSLVVGFLKKPNMTRFDANPA